MRLKTPSFWYGPPGVISDLLQPFSHLYAAASYLRRSVQPYKSRLPVACIGNIVAGGSGKTPVALAVMKLIREAALAQRPCFLTRGYGGNNKGPLEADWHMHKARDVGDETLLLARFAPAIVSADRGAGAVYAESQNYDLIVMDDGLQNPGLHKDMVFIVIDGVSGVGNCRMIPAGPLREPPGPALQKADAFIFIGEDRQNIRSILPADKPVFTASLEIADGWKADKKNPYIAFCGIAHPKKFKQTLDTAGVALAAFHSFADHHSFTARELEKLAAEAKAKNARLITTAKDAARLPSDFTVDILPVEIAWEDKDAVVSFLRERLS